MISRFFETPPRVTGRGQRIDEGFYHPDHTNQMISFVFDFRRIPIVRM